MYPALRNLTAVRSPIDILTWAKQAFKRKSSNMSSLSRRACYKCGVVGHYAGDFSHPCIGTISFHTNRVLEVCSSPERLCYNCKTSNCPLLHGTTNFLTGKQPGNALTLTLCYGRILNVFLTALQDMNQTGARSPVRLKVRARRREEAVWGAQR